MEGKRQWRLSCSGSDDILLSHRGKGAGGQSPQGRLLHTEQPADRDEQVAGPSAMQLDGRESDGNMATDEEPLLPGRAAAQQQRMHDGRARDSSSSGSSGSSDGAATPRDTAGSDEWAQRRAAAAASRDDSSGYDGPDEVEEEGSSEEEEEMRANDCQCAWCDDGGDLLLCDGTCMRGFHVQPGVSDPDNFMTECNVMGMPLDLFSKIQGSLDTFLCPSCLAKEHQCFACKKHGCSDWDSPDKQEVFRCAVADCGKYYHPACVKQKPEAMKSGSGYICPLHECARPLCALPCGRAGTVTELIPCRRCMLAYHAACMPAKLMIAHEKGPHRLWIPPRNEDGTLHEDRDIDTSLVYCMKHQTAWYSLFTPSALKAWRLKYATNFPGLQSSAPILEEQRGEAAAALEEQQTMAQQAARAASYESNSEDDRPLARRNLAQHLLTPERRRAAAAAVMQRSAAPASVQNAAEQSAIDAALPPNRKQTSAEVPATSRSQPRAAAAPARASPPQWQQLTGSGKRHRSPSPATSGAASKQPTAAPKQQRSPVKLPSAPQPKVQLPQAAQQKRQVLRLPSLPQPSAKPAVASQPAHTQPAFGAAEQAPTSASWAALPAAHMANQEVTLTQRMASKRKAASVSPAKPAAPLPVRRSAGLPAAASPPQHSTGPPAAASSAGFGSAAATAAVHNSMVEQALRRLSSSSSESEGPAERAERGAAAAQTAATQSMRPDDDRLQLPVRKRHKPGLEAVAGAAAATDASSPAVTPQATLATPASSAAQAPDSPTALLAFASGHAGPPFANSLRGSPVEAAGVLQDDAAARDAQPAKGVSAAAAAASQALRAASAAAAAGSAGKMQPPLPAGLDIATPFSSMDVTPISSSDVMSTSESEDDVTAADDPEAPSHASAAATLLAAAMANGSQDLLAAAVASAAGPGASREEAAAATRLLTEAAASGSGAALAATMAAVAGLGASRGSAAAAAKALTAAAPAAAAAAARPAETTVALGAPATAAAAKPAKPARAVSEALVAAAAVRPASQSAAAAAAAAAEPAAARAVSEAPISTAAVKPVSPQAASTSPAEPAAAEPASPEATAAAATPSLAATDGGSVGLSEFLDGDINADEEVSPEQVELQVEQDLEVATRLVSYDELEAKIRTIKGYEKTASRKTLDEGQLRTFRDAVKAATDKPRHASLLLGPQTLRHMNRSEDDFKIWLAPFLHGKRYSSYGRHFSKPALLQKVAEVLEHFMRPNDVIVDYSCGANEFVPIVKRWAAKQGFKVFGRAFDIFTACNLEDFELRNWFDCKPGELPIGDRLVIGLNPPFGKANQLANGFVQHAAKFNPRVIVLIAPPKTDTPLGYRIVYENIQLTADRVFYVPGLKEDSWNKIAPPLRIMIREDSFDGAWADKQAYTTVDTVQNPPAHMTMGPGAPMPYLTDVDGTGCDHHPLPHMSQVQHMGHGLGPGMMLDAHDPGQVFTVMNPGQPGPQILVPIREGHFQDRLPPFHDGFQTEAAHFQQEGRPQFQPHSSGEMASYEPMWAGSFDQSVGDFQQGRPGFEGPFDPRLPGPPRDHFQEGAPLLFDNLPPPEWQPDPCERCGSPSHGGAECWRVADGQRQQGMQCAPSFDHRPGSGAFRHVKGGYCDRCGQAGHRSDSCPDPAPGDVFFCRRCGGPNHIARNCPNLSDQRRPQQQQQAAAQKQSAGRGERRGAAKAAQPKRERPAERRNPRRKSVGGRGKGRGSRK